MVKINNRRGYFTYIFSNFDEALPLGSSSYLPPISHPNIPNQTQHLSSHSKLTSISHLTLLQPHFNIASVSSLPFLFLFSSYYNTYTTQHLISNRQYLIGIFFGSTFQTKQNQTLNNLK